MKKKIEELEKRIEVLEKKGNTVIIQQPYQYPYYPGMLGQQRCARCGGTFTGNHYC